MDIDLIIAFFPRRRGWSDQDGTFDGVACVLPAQAGVVRMCVRR
ncbi:hypothetical protein [Streptomyces sp. TSRI0281]